MNLFQSSKILNFESLRYQMVETQIISRDIEDKKVINAMKKVPRHLFVAKDLEEDAYNDHPLPIGLGQTISQPYMVAQMTSVLGTCGSSRILEIGTGSGYQASILAELVAEVFTIECIETLAHSAERVVRGLGYENIFMKIGDGTLGWQEHSTYDGILITAATPFFPLPLVEQLKDGGIIVAPIGDKSIQTLTKARKIGNKLHQEQLFDCVFVPLVGRYGWRE
ncbi:MAG: protein-L-isoaspartate(D-aspartate) O-methyltransferase [Candidatus Stahlbacteria bacterium]|nr:protein-L-isoaspartate(D-aspartate) O-methyltransferase [Candidatus Stahlbacteria bacterium]